MAYYRRLRDLRNDSEFTQQEIVDMLGLQKTTYTNYEQGKREIPFWLVVELAKIYNVTIDYIAELTQVPKKLYPHKKRKF